MSVELHEYQSNAVDFIVSNFLVDEKTGGALLFSPGCGKTITTLEIIRTLRDLGEVNNVLVIAPLRVCSMVWPREIAKWGFDFSHRSLCGRVKMSLTRPAPFIELCNPESVHLLLDHAGRWDMIVIDESSRFKNWSAKCTKNLRKLVPSASKRMILTGTPTPQGLHEIFSQIYMLDLGERLGKNITVFRSRYMNRGSQNGPKGFWGGYSWEIRDTAKSEIVSRISDIVVRADETELSMPELIVNDVYCQLSPAAKKQYDKLKRELFLQLESTDVLAANAASAYAKCRQVAGGTVYDEEKVPHEVHDEKLNALSELDEGLGGKPLLIIYTYKSDRDRILGRYPGTPVIDGATGKSIDDVVDGWNNSKYTRLLLQVRAGSHGLNLQGGKCVDVAFFGLPDSVEAYDQAYRRVYRQGVSGSHVRIHRLLTEGTVDEIIRDRVDGKIKDQQEFLNSLRRHAGETK